MTQFIIDNWLIVSTIVYAAVSEIIGISPLKSNSVVQLVMQVIGSLLKKK